MKEQDATANPQYMRALERANAIRLARADLKHRIALEEVSVADVILECPPEAQSMAIADLLMSQPRWGHTRCRKLLAQIPMSEKKTIGAVTERQRRLLAELLTNKTPSAGAWGPVTEDDNDLWDELEKTTRRYNDLSTELAGLAADRDELIRSLSHAGVPRRLVAEVASLTVGRVQQIIDGGKLEASASPAAAELLIAEER